MPDNVLALLGGQPVRTKPFMSRPHIDERELNAVTDSIREGVFSRFIGSPTPGIRELIRKPSRELVDLDEPFSFMGGPNVRRFEAAWAEAHEVPYAVAVNSATSAITALLMALDVGPGAEVITTPLSFTATATAIVAANAVPVFADIDPDTYCLSAEAVEQAITPRTKCIMPVHWCGNAGDFDAIIALAEKHGLIVIEDSCQAPGTRYQERFLGGLGRAGVFSFSEPKNVMTGEGGMITTFDRDLAAKCRLIRNHGEAIPTADDDDEFIANTIGFNFRMVETAAAIGWVQTGKLDMVNGIRQRNHSYLVERLNEIIGQHLSPQRLTHPETFAAYTSAFRWSEESSGAPRDVVAAALRAEGIPAATGVGRLMSDNPLFGRELAYGRLGCPFKCSFYQGRADYSPARLPTAHQVHDREYLAFFLAGWPNTTEDMDDIAAAFGKIAANLDQLAAYNPEDATARLSLGRGRSTEE